MPINAENVEINQFVPPFQVDGLLTDQDILVYDEELQVFKNQKGNGSSSNGTLGDLSDVDTAGAYPGSHIVYDGSGWIIGPPGTGNSLVDLIDTTISGQTLADVLKFNGSTWINAKVDYNELTSLPVLFSGDYNDLTNAPVLATVATSGDYDDLINLPVLFSGDYNDLTNAPVLATVATSGDYNDLINTPVPGSSTLVGLSDTNNTIVANGFLRWDGTGSQVDYSATIATSDITGLATVATSGDYGDLINIPTEFNPTLHAHVKSDITDFSDSDYATAAQGATADSALQPGDVVDQNLFSTIISDSGSVTAITPTSTFSVLGGTNVTTSIVGNVVTVNAATGGSGEANTASNLGIGSGLFASKVADDLQFKSLIGGSNVSLSSDGTTITINSINTGEVNTDSNLPGGIGLFSSKLASDLRFKSIIGGTNISLSSDANTITVNSTASGETNTASNLPGGTGLFASKLASDLRFKSLIGGTNVSLSSDGNNITINATGGAGGETNTASNLGGGEGVYATKVVDDLQFKSFIGGTNISLSSDGTTITIDAAGGGATSLDDLTDTTITSAATGEVLRYNGSQWVDAVLDYSDLSGTPALAAVATSGDYNDLTNTPTVPTVVSDLTDVNTAGATAGQVLKLAGGVWVPADDDVIAALDDIPDVNVSGVTDGQVLTFNTVASEWQAATPSAGGSGEVNTASNLGGGEGTFASKVVDDLQFKSLIGGTNVSLSSDGTTITIDATGAGGASELDDLTDVDTTTTAPVTGDILVYDGANWVPGDSNANTGLEYAKIVYNLNGTVDPDAAIAVPVSERSAGISSVVIASTASNNIIIEFNFVGHKYPPATVIFYGYAYDANQYVLKYATTNGQLVTTGGSSGSPSPNPFGSFDDPATYIQHKVDRSETGSSNGSGFPGNATHSFIQWKF